MVEPVRHRRTKGAATDMLEPKATASHLDSTLFGRDRRVGECLLLREERKSGLRGPISVFDPERTSWSGSCGVPSKSHAGLKPFARRIVSYNRVSSPSRTQRLSL